MSNCWGLSELLGAELYAAVPEGLAFKGRFLAPTTPTMPTTPTPPRESTSVGEACEPVS